MKIEKLARNSVNHVFWTSFNRARDAFELILQRLKLENPELRVLLPNYIGLSMKEGSGIFDPIIRSGVEYGFYELNENLNVNVEDLKLKIGRKFDVILLVHYFGFVDPKIEDIVQLAKRNGLTIIEDCAHALLSEFFSNSCGIFGDYSFYSLHKLFPFSSGGMLKSYDYIRGLQEKFEFMNENIFEISKIRRENYLTLQKLIDNIPEICVPLKETLPRGIVPQTFPILIKSSNRDEVYNDMNNLGWGVVSLYHTMIEPLENIDGLSTRSISSSVMNLPLHQNADKRKYETMISDLKRVVELRRNDL